MACLTILTVPDARLKVKALPVPLVDDSIRKLMDDMMETMYADDGAGLAATQVGINKRVIVVDLGEHTPDMGPLKFANPEIVWRSTEIKKNWEACLSVPGQSAQVERSAAIRLRYLDENNTVQEKDFDEIINKEITNHNKEIRDQCCKLDFSNPSLSNPAAKLSIDMSPSSSASKTS